jgi:hypothetical protein
MGVQLGGLVGYGVRFEDVTNQVRVQGSVSSIVSTGCGMCDGVQLGPSVHMGAHSPSLPLWVQCALFEDATG